MKKYLGSVLVLALALTGCLADRFSGAGDAHRGGRWTDGGFSWADEGGDGSGGSGGGGDLPSCVANNYTPGSVYASTALVPDDGDKVCASRSNPGDGPVNPGIKQALDNAGWAHALLYGAWQLPPANSVDGVFVNFTWAPPIGFASASIPTTPYWGVGKTGFAVNVAATLGSPLANNTWYYIYFTSAGALAVSTTGPDISGRYMDGDETKGLIGFCRTDGAGVIIPFSSSGRHYSYAAPRAWSLGGSTVLRMANFNSVTNSTVAFTGFVPPFATSTRVAYFLSGDLVAGATLQDVTATGWTTGAGLTGLWATGGTASTSPANGDFLVPLPLAAATQVNFFVSSWTSGSVAFGVSEFDF